MFENATVKKIRPTLVAIKKREVCTGPRVDCFTDKDECTVQVSRSCHIQCRRIRVLWSRELPLFLQIKISMHWSKNIDKVLLYLS